MRWYEYQTDSAQILAIFDHVVTFSTVYLAQEIVQARPECQSSLRIGPVWVMSRLWSLSWEGIPVTACYTVVVSAMRLRQSDVGLFGTTGLLHYGFWRFVLQGFQHELAAEAQHVFYPLIDLEPRRIPKWCPVQSYKLFVPGQGELCRRSLKTDSAENLKNIETNEILNKTLQNDVSLPSLFWQFAPWSSISAIGGLAAGPKPGRSNLKKKLRSPVVVPLPAARETTMLPLLLRTI